MIQFDLGVVPEGAQVLLCCQHSSFRLNNETSQQIVSAFLHLVSEATKSTELSVYRLNAAWTAGLETTDVSWLQLTQRVCTIIHASGKELTESCLLHLTHLNLVSRSPLVSGRAMATVPLSSTAAGGTAEMAKGACGKLLAAISCSQQLTLQP